MKLLKIVLISLITIVIYSFTTIEKTIAHPIDKIEKIVQYDGCVTITFKKDENGNYNKTLGREYAFYMLKNRMIGIGPLFEQGRDYERYYYTTNGTTNVGSTSNSGDNGTDPDDGGRNYWDYIKKGMSYATYGVGGCNSAMITPLN